MPILTAIEAQYGRNDSQDQTIAPKYLKILADCEARRIAREAKSAETEKAALYADYEAGRSALYADYFDKCAPLKADDDAQRAALYADYLANRDVLFADYQAKCDALHAINAAGGN